MYENHYRRILSLAVGHLAASSKSLSEINLRQSPALQAALQTLYSCERGKVLYTGSIEGNAFDLPVIQSMSTHARSAGGRVDRCGMAVAHDAAVIWLRSRRKALETLLEISLSTSFVQNPVFLYYEREGDRTDPHFDERALDVTIVICLQRVSSSTKSALRFIHHDRIERVDLHEGGCAIFEGSKILHGVEAVGPDESMKLLTIGLSNCYEYR